MKKVLHVLTDTNMGGAGRYLFNLLANWDYDRYEVVVACPKAGELERQLKAKGIRVFALSGGENSLEFKHVGELMRIISEEKVDIVHTHASLAGRIAGKLSGCHIVMTRHGLKKVKKDIVHRVGTAIMTRALTDNIIAISRAVKINLMEAGVPADMIKIIYNGLDLDKFKDVKPRMRRDFNLTGGPIIGTVARLVPEKGHEYAIKAMPGVIKEFPGAHLVIIGDGPLKENLQRMSEELGVDEHVSFLGYQVQVESLEADFDVFVLPSVSEGLGLALLEAMALGKPVVASEVGGIPEVVKNGISGLLVPPADEKALAQAIVSILSSKQRAYSLGEAARKAVYEKFSARVMVERTMEIYDKILRKTGE